MIVERGENEVTNADRLSNGSCSEAMLPVGCHGNTCELSTGVNKDATQNSVQEAPEAENRESKRGEIVEEEEETANSARESHSDVRCKSLKKSCHKCWKPVRTKYNPLPEKASKLQRAKFAFLCPPHGKLGDFAAAVLTFLIFWAVLIGVTGDEAVPGGNIFALVMLFLCCVVCGHLAAIIRLPALLGNDTMIFCEKSSGLQMCFQIHTIQLILLMPKPKFFLVHHSCAHMFQSKIGTTFYFTLSL